jgi:hypothetical protein
MDQVKLFSQDGQRETRSYLRIGDTPHVGQESHSNSRYIWDFSPDRCCDYHYLMTACNKGTREVLNIPLHPPSRSEPYRCLEDPHERRPHTYREGRATDPTTQARELVGEFFACLLFEIMAKWPATGDL